MISKHTLEGKFWTFTPKEAEAQLGTDLEGGLSESEAGERLRVFGRNALKSSPRAAGLKIFLNQLRSPLIFILIFAAIVTFSIAHYRDAAFIMIAVIVNSALGFYQESKAERALAQLKNYIKDRTRVIRGGREREIDAEEIVPGDVIRLSLGDRVPADAKVIFTNDFQVDEAILTGESLPVTKSIAPDKEEAPISDQDSMTFGGTLVTQGVCSAVVVRTDAFTEIGKIASLIAKSENEKTPLQKAIAKFSVNLSLFLAILTIAIFIIGVSSGESTLDMFLTSVAIAVSAIPEGLPIAMTVILAIGVERMARRKGVVRRLIAAEALGDTTVILTDKTGTLTEAKMVLAKIIPFRLNEDELLSRALSNASVLIENPEENPEEWRMSGRIMEVSLVRSAARRGIPLEKIADKSHVLQTMPFNAVQKFSATLIRESGRHLLVFFGAPDILLRHVAESDDRKSEIIRTINELAGEGERVLGLATKEIAFTENFSLAKDLSLSQLSFEGLITFRDPIRPKIKDTIREVREAGIKTVILTGDHHGTAVAVAREIGMNTASEAVLDASDLVNLSEDELAQRLPHLAVISRVTPTDKLRIAKMFQKSGEVVAMTGDGVNDAPSIKQADVGIAMGSGTEVAQSVADLVLLDDNFETIVAAVEEGRQILRNIRKVLVYLLSNVADGLILIGGSLLLGIPLPLNALQILWVNFFSDSFPAIAFAFERDLGLHRHPRRRETLFDPLMKFLILVIGISTSLLLFILYFVLLRLGFDETLVRTFIFAAFGTYTLLLSLSVRSLEKSIFSYPLFSNHYLVGGIVLGIILMGSAIYLSPLQKLLGTTSLPPAWVLGVFLVGIFNIFLIEISKKLFNGRLSTQHP